MFQSLAEPNLIALNGKEASFLAGGEFPYPVPQGNFGAFTIHFKEYGVRLNFTPTVLGGDLINLKLAPEVSSLDFANAVIIEGFRIPALTSRRTETEVELRDGQTFAIAGLMNNTALSSMRKIPGIGDIPMLGPAVQEPRVSEGSDRARRHGDAAHRAPRFAGRLRGPAVTGRAVSRSPEEDDAEPGSPTSARRASRRIVRRSHTYRPRPRHPRRRPRRQRIQQPPAPVAQPASVPQQQPAQSQAPASENSPSANHSSTADHRPEMKPLTKEQLRALEQAREEERKAAERAARDDAQQRKAMEAAQKARLEQEKRDQKLRAEQARKDDEQRKQAEKLDLERQKREAKEKEEEQQRQKDLTDAALRLKQAQDAYQAEVAKNNKGGTK